MKYPTLEFQLRSTASLFLLVTPPRGGVRRRAIPVWRGLVQLGLLIGALMFWQPLAVSYETLAFTNFVGAPGVSGSADGTGSAARFQSPTGIAVDGAGNLYVADQYNYTIRKVTPVGVVTTLAGSAGQYGSADGAGSAARFNRPIGVAVDTSGNIYVADRDNSTIRKVLPGGLVTTLAGSAGLQGSADGTGSAARFQSPTGIAVDGAGNLYVADVNSYTIRKVTPEGVVSTLAGSAGQSGSSDGTGSAARFRSLTGVAVDGADNLYVADAGNYTIRKVAPDGVVTTLAGSAGQYGSVDGTGSAARFYGPFGLAMDGTGAVYVTDSANCTIRKVTPGGVVTTLAGMSGQAGNADGVGSAARFNVPSGVAVDDAGIVYVADRNDRISRGVPPAPPTITSQPQSSTNLAGTTASLTVAASGTGPFSYQWRFYGTNLASAIGQTLTLTNVQSANAGPYRVEVTTPYGQEVSSQAVLAVVGRAPVILSQPQGQDVLAGENVTNSVATTGSEPQTFQWQVNGTNLPSATSDTLTVTNFQAADQGVYRVVVSNAFGFVISSNATLFNSIALVLDAPYLCFTNGGDLRWFAQEAVLHFGTNAMQSGLVGDSMQSFLETTVAGSGVLSYWWRASSETNSDFLRFAINGVIQTNISGEVYWQQCSFRLPTGPQRLRWTFIRDANIQTNKWTGWLDELSYVPDVAPAFTLQPTNISIRAGEDVVFAAGVIGTPPPVLQWQCNGTNVPGATNLSLALTNVQMAWSGCTFQLAASNLVGTTLSSNALLTVTPTAPIILTGPQSLAVMPGSNAAFGVNAIGAEPLRYQWQFEGANLSKATKAAITISNALAASAGSYRVVVSNSYGVTFSSNAVLTVLTFPGAVNAGGAQRWTWATGNWFMQTNVTHDGAGAAQSGTTLDSQSSVMQTTVVGPGSVSFWWKVSSELDYDFLKFSTNGVEVASISGEVGWQWVTVNLGHGSQTLRWAYTKDDSTTEGTDAGWVDGVRVLTPSRLQAPERLAGDGFRLKFGNGQGWPLGLEDAANYEVRVSTNLANWLSLTNSLSVTNGLLFLNDTGNAYLPQKFYQVIGR